MLKTTALKLSLFVLVIVISSISCVTNSDSNTAYAQRTIQSLEGNNFLQMVEGEKVRLAGLPDNEKSKAFIRQYLKKEEITLLWDSHYDKDGNYIAYVFGKDGTCLNSLAIQSGIVRVDDSYPYDSLELYRGTKNIVSSTPTSSTECNKPLKELYNEWKKSVVMVFAKENSYYSSGMSTGTGFFIREDGVVISNHHVYSRGMDGAVQLEGDEETDYPIIEVLEDNEALDYVIFKIDTKGKIFKPVKFTTQNSDKGDPVFVIGHPKGMKFTLTEGIISNIDQGARQGDIMTNAAVNNGNSGGPLFNMCGEVIGLITYKRKDNCENCGFALDIRKVQFP
jgi:serine protease Do